VSGASFNRIINFNSRDLSAATTNERILGALYTTYNSVYLFIIRRIGTLDKIMCRLPIAARTHRNCLLYKLLLQYRVDYVQCCYQRGAGPVEHFWLHITR